MKTIISILFIAFAIACSPPENAEEHFYIPGSFSPDGDGLNDTWVVKRNTAYAITGFSLEIYNSTFQLLFQSADPINGWDGKKDNAPLPSAVYTYVLSYTATSDSIDYESFNATGTVFLMPWAQ